MGHEALDPLPDGDVLIHAGDATGGTLQSTLTFLRWFASQPHRYKLFVPGNHDSYVEHALGITRGLVPPSVTLLIDEACEIAGRVFYGSPWTPEFLHWAFMRPRGEGMARVWSGIPDDTAVLITHGPPHGILDVHETPPRASGCEALRWRVEQLPQLELHVFGHIHESYGRRTVDGRVFVNAATWMPEYRPIVVDLPAR